MKLRRVEVTILGKKHSINKFKANLIKEYRAFYLIDTGIFKTCINKADIQCNDIILKFI
ncbi:MAG: hypothetical protein RSB70_03630 [Clostridium sp.]